MDRFLLLGNINSVEVWAFFDTIEELTNFASEQEVNVVYILKNHIEVEIPDSLKKPQKMATNYCICALFVRIRLKSRC